MPTKTLSELSKSMQKIDIAMLSTYSGGGEIAGRPMSNNGEVEYDGTSYYFTYDQSRTVSDIQGHSKVALAFQGEKSFQVAVEGEASLIRDTAAMKDHWTPDLDRWFKDGLDTEGLVMIQVDATRIHYWDGEDNGEVKR
ncbi:pyridoxamine 5'-phosphate oxidase family protein [Deinococcus rubellus]|uniref:Pyridoxamine 5'-phosphate oxidase family protein n=1 Tax=Deinococcus rubellus TaxID=1889240 RepID=A0ABY5YMB4_9DEIO|nr:pyridoxamine 5'-phosphate oxidase family protein [Deinococcus rubellus]UWX65482.1 pyridoxamine 5'-phosphate oxidase family protein [Deinococcus rubellus]